MSVLGLTYQDKQEMAVWGPCPPLPQAVQLLDGTVVSIRLVRPEDAQQLQAFFARLSPRTIYLRFLLNHKTLSHQEAKALAAADCRSQVVLVATRREATAEDIIAVAQYAIARSDDGDWAEPAIVVEDRYQRRGLGTLLLKWLSAHAWSHGVRCFRATVHPSNRQILRFVEYSQLPFERRIEAGAWDIVIRLDPNTAGHRAS